jgi:hypothetical protein
VVNKPAKWKDAPGLKQFYDSFVKIQNNKFYNMMQVDADIGIIEVPLFVSSNCF